MTKEINVPELAGVIEGPSVALLDVRETAEYNLAHIPGAVSLPRRLIEYRLNELVPWHGTTVIVCDDDGRRATLAAGTLEEMGYTDAAVLKAGTNAWVTAGGDTEWGVNVPSKDFGEKVLLQQPVPEISPSELNDWLENGKRVVLVDSRTPEEHQRFPGDYEAQVGQGPITFHSEENLVSSDRGVALVRRLLKQQLEALAEGRDPIGVSFDDTAPPVPFEAGNFLVEDHHAS